MVLVDDSQKRKQGYKNSKKQETPGKFIGMNSTCPVFNPIRNKEIS